MIKKYLTLRVWILIAFLVFSVMAINPRPWNIGVEIKQVDDNSLLSADGLTAGEIIKSVNGQSIVNVDDYNSAIEKLKVEPKTISIETDKGNFEYEITENIGFVVKTTNEEGNVTNNLTVVRADEDIPIKKDMQIISINGEKIKDPKHYSEVVLKLIPKTNFVLVTDKREYAVLLPGQPEIRVGEAAKNNLQTGLELQGGSRALLKPISELGEVTDKNIVDLIDVLQERLNVYGLADITIRSASDLAGEKFVAVEVAGATREEVKELIAKQGVFEAKIAGENVFEGGKGDIPFVCKGDGSCSGIRPPCSLVAADQWACTFQFSISLSPEAANKHADITGKLSVNTSASGSYLSSPLELYLDGELRDSLQISSTLKGQDVTQISITGPGYGATEEAAYNAAIEAMNKLQTIMISGSLPLKLEIIKLDTISPALGEEFVKNSLFAGLLALVGVSCVLLIRYRSLKIVAAVLITSLSELLMTLGFAALIRWNLDLASIAGLIAALGTGVDDQIVILDELSKGEEKFINWKDRVKRAFGVIIASYLTLTAAMIPLWNAGAGLLRGFAVTTIVGITVGVLITRPAFASVVERILKKE